MQWISGAALALFVAYTAWSFDSDRGYFWSLIFGYAGALALLSLLRVNVRIAALSGALLYMILVVRFTFGAPDAAVTWAEIAGMHICAIFCLGQFVLTRAGKASAAPARPATVRASAES